MAIKPNEHYAQLANGLAAHLKRKHSKDVLAGWLAVEIVAKQIEDDMPAERVHELDSALKALRFNWRVIDELYAELRKQPAKLASRGGHGKSEKQKEADRGLFAFLDRHAGEKPKQLRARLKSGATFDMADEDAKNAVRRWQRARK